MKLSQLVKLSLHIILKELIYVTHFQMENYFLWLKRNQKYRLVLNLKLQYHLPQIYKFLINMEINYLFLSLELLITVCSPPIHIQKQIIVLLSWIIWIIHLNFQTVKLLFQKINKPKCQEVLQLQVILIKIGVIMN